MKHRNIIINILVGILLIVSFHLIMWQEKIIQDYKKLNLDLDTTNINLKKELDVLQNEVMPTQNRLEDLIDAINFKESSCLPDKLIPTGPNNDTGPFQITPIALKEYNQQYGTNFTLEDCKIYHISKDITLGLLNIGVKKYYEKYNKYPTIQEIARMHNGGIYKGYLYEDTQVYGEQIEELFNSYKTT